MAAALLQALHLSRESQDFGIQALEVSITDHVKLVLVRKVYLLLAIHLLFDFALLGQLLQRLHHRRLAQPMFPLQVPEHVLGTVGPVLLL